LPWVASQLVTELVTLFTAEGDRPKCWLAFMQASFSFSTAAQSIRTSTAAVAGTLVGRSSRIEPAAKRRPKSKCQLPS
jgi:hypothetical protein